MMNVFGFHSLYTAYIILQLVVHRRTSQGFTLLDKSHSYMAFDTWDASTSSKLKFKFKTACSYCLLLYLDGNRFKSNGTNYIELTMEQKQLKMKAQFIAPFIESVTLGNELNDLEWHSVEISRTLNDFHITVDDYKGSITVGNIEVKLSSYLFVGGVKRSYLKNAARKEGLLYIPRLVLMFYFKEIRLFPSAHFTN